MSQVAATARLSTVARPQVSARRAVHVRCEATSSQRVKQAGIALFGAALLVSGAPAFADADLGDGADIFNSRCIACHSGGNNTLVAERTLKKDAIAKYLDGGLSVDAIVNQVTNGKGQMPSFAAEYDEDEILNVASYVYKTSSEDAW